MTRGIYIEVQEDQSAYQVRVNAEPVMIWITPSNPNRTLGMAKVVARKIQKELRKEHKIKLPIIIDPRAAFIIQQNRRYQQKIKAQKAFEYTSR